VLRLTTLILEITGRLEKCFGQEASLLRAAVLDKWYFHLTRTFEFTGSCSKFSLEDTSFNKSGNEIAQNE
jgi:hypothetical protein